MKVRDIVGELTPEQHEILKQINRDKNQWYRTTNANGIAKGHKPLFDTRFHDYAHSAPATINNLSGGKILPPRANGLPRTVKPVGISLQGESMASLMEDSVLDQNPLGYVIKRNSKGMPLSKQGGKAKQQFLQNIVDVRNNDPNIKAAYDALHNLGKYSVAKKTGVPFDQVTPAKMMLNKFSYMGTVCQL